MEQKQQTGQESKCSTREAALRAELDRIVKILISKIAPLRITIFGSLAAGEVWEWSDIDLAIVVDSEKPFLDRIYDVTLLTQPQLSVNFFVYTPGEVRAMKEAGHYFYVDEIEGKGVILYERAA